MFEFLSGLLKSDLKLDRYEMMVFKVNKITSKTFMAVKFVRLSESLSEYY